MVDILAEEADVVVSQTGLRRLEVSRQVVDGIIYYNPREVLDHYKAKFAKAPVIVPGLRTSAAGAVVMKIYEEDITGQRFERLVAVARANGKGLWLLRCDCGNEHEALIYNLRNGGTRSCGCISADLRAAKAKNSAGSPAPIARPPSGSGKG